MKKIKILSCVSAVIALSGVGIVSASCSCSNSEEEFTVKLDSNEVPLDEDYEI